MFSNQQLFRSFLLVLACSFASFVVVYVLLSLFYRKQNRFILAGIALLLAIAAGACVNFFFLRTVFYPYHHYILFVFIIVLFCIIFFHFEKQFILFMSVLCVITLCSLGYSIYKNSDVVLDPMSEELSIKLKHKPNIYVFWLESFHSLDMLENVYGVDTASFKEFLDEKDFYVQPDSYSSSSFTLASMTDLYSMGKVEAQNYYSGNSDVERTIRELLLGGNGNYLLKILKDNGYVTAINFESTYYYYSNFQGDYLDYGYEFGETGFLYNYYPCFAFCKWNDKISKELFDISKVNSPLKMQVVKKINMLKQLNKPYFLAFKGGVFHTAYDGSYDYTKRDQWIASRRYSNAVQDNFNEIEEIIEIILEQDEDAIIVMFGDHGADTYRTRLSLDQLINKAGITLTDYANDQFKVLMTYRIPEKYKNADIEDGALYLTHTNIFRYIFSILAQNPDYIKNLDAPVSKLSNGSILVRNGEVIEK